MVVLNESDEVPQDINAFFGHPLVSGTNVNDGALALLHEYESLPAIGESHSTPTTSPRSLIAENSPARCGIHAQDVSQKCKRQPEVKLVRDCSVLMGSTQDDDFNLDSPSSESTQMEDYSLNDIELPQHQILVDDDESLESLLNGAPEEVEEKKEENYAYSSMDVIKQSLHHSGASNFLLPHVNEDNSPHHNKITHTDISYRTSVYSDCEQSPLSSSHSESPNNQCHEPSPHSSPIKQEPIQEPFTSGRQTHDVNGNEIALPTPIPSSPLPLIQNTHVNNTPSHSTLPPISLPTRAGPGPVVTDTVTLPGKGSFICQWMPPIQEQKNDGEPMNGVLLPPQPMNPHMVYRPPFFNPAPVQRFRQPWMTGDARMQLPPAPFHPDFPPHMIMQQTWCPRFGPPMEGSPGHQIFVPQYNCSPKANQLIMEKRQAQQAQLHAFQQAQMAAAEGAPHNLSAVHLKSPAADSGYGDINNPDGIPSSPTGSEVASNPGSPESSRNKKRKYPVGNYARQLSKQVKDAETLIYAKRENDDTGFVVDLDAPTSSCAKLKDDRMTYLNKGQTYMLNIKNTLPKEQQISTFLKTTVILRVRSQEDEGYLWRFWDSRITTEDDSVNALDADEKGVSGITEASLRNLGSNAFTFSWIPSEEEPVKVPISIHCLSTDFCSQKGVKGKSIHLQVDTYDSSSNIPLHRAYAQFKIFCDKGAERKLRDEERRRNLDASKMEDHHPPCPATQFYSMADLHTDLYIHTNPQQRMENLEQAAYLQPRSPAQNLAIPNHDQLNSYYDTEAVQSKKVCPYPDDTIATDKPRWIYVKTEVDDYYKQIHLNHPTISEMLSQLIDKFNLQTDFTELLKRTRRGIMVIVDDNVVRCLPNESLYSLSSEEHNTKRQLILTEMPL